MKLSGWSGYFQITPHNPWGSGNKYGYGKGNSEVHEPSAAQNDWRSSCLGSRRCRRSHGVNRYNPANHIYLQPQNRPARPRSRVSILTWGYRHRAGWRHLKTAESPLFGMTKTPAFCMIGPITHCILHEENDELHHTYHIFKVSCSCKRQYGSRTCWYFLNMEKWKRRNDNWQAGNFKWSGPGNSFYITMSPEGWKTYIFKKVYPWVWPWKSPVFRK